MNLVIRIPDDLASRLGAGGHDLERQALEALVLEGYRAGRVSKDELAGALGLDSLDQVDGFLKSHDVFEPCTVQDIDREVDTLIRLGF